MMQPTVGGIRMSYGSANMAQYREVEVLSLSPARRLVLLYTHLLPILPNAIAVRAFLKGVDDVRPDGVKVGHDGLIVRLPGGTTNVDVGDIN